MSASDTHWAPKECSTPGYREPSALLPGNRWSNLFGDARNSGEVYATLPLALEEEWTAEEGMFQLTAPVFDSQGNLYVQPVLAKDGSILISLDAATGARRFAIEGTTVGVAGTSTPVVLANPDQPGQEIVYTALYDRIVAVRTDGSIVWDAPTGLTVGADPLDHLVRSLLYLPDLDALVMVTFDGVLAVFDRASGQSIADSFEMPGAKSRTSLLGFHWSRILAEQYFGELTQADPDGGFSRLLDRLQGHGTEVSNAVAVDAATNRLWITSTLGPTAHRALYAIDVVPSGSGVEVQEACSQPFFGSLGQPALGADGQRVYAGAGEGWVLAIDANTCDVAWVWQFSIAETVRSIAVASDNGEIYVAGTKGIYQLFDDGEQPTLGWTKAATELFTDVTFGQPVNLNAVTVGPNGVMFQAAVSTSIREFGDLAIPSMVATGVLDRLTGEPRALQLVDNAASAALSVGPDSAAYIGNGPVGSLLAYFLGYSEQPPRTGVTKYRPESYTVVARDSICGNASRVSNLKLDGRRCSADSRQDNIDRVRQSLTETLSTLSDAFADGELTERDFKRATRLVDRSLNRLRRAEKVLADPRLAFSRRYETSLTYVERPLIRACNLPGLSASH